LLKIIVNKIDFQSKADHLETNFFAPVTLTLTLWHSYTNMTWRSRRECRFK